MKKRKISDIIKCRRQLAHGRTIQKDSFQHIDPTQAVSFVSSAVSSAQHATPIRVDRLCTSHKTLKESHVRLWTLTRTSLAEYPSRIPILLIMIQVSTYRISDPNNKATATGQTPPRLLDTRGDRLELGANERGSPMEIDREHMNNENNQLSTLISHKP
ncbi:hypothetical protein V2G26_018528 [Clonostachys chloroleuca]